MGIAISEKPEQTSVMLEPTVKKDAKHIAIDLGMNFSGFNRGVLKAVLFLIGNKGFSKTWQTKIVTLCNNPTESPIIMVELLKRLYTPQHPELTTHFDTIIKTIKDAEH